MVKAQKWLDQNYPIEGRGKIEILNISYKELTGSLKLEGFTNLEALNCHYNSVAELDLSDCNNLESLECHNNELFDISFLTSLKNPQKLTILNIGANSFPPEELSIFSRFTGLEKLWIRDNRFYGSLKPLSKLAKLRYVEIINTNKVEGDIEYFPESLKMIWCSPNSEVGKQLQNYHLEASSMGNVNCDLKTWRKDNKELIESVRKAEEESIEELNRGISPMLQKSEENDLEESQLTEQTKLVSQLQIQIKQLEENLNKKEKEISGLLVQIQSKSSDATQTQPTNLPAPTIPESEKEKLNNFLENYIVMMKKEVSNCQLVVNHEAATEKEKEHFIAEKKLLEYKIEQAQNFTKK